MFAGRSLLLSQNRLGCHRAALLGGAAANLRVSTRLSAASAATNRGQSGALTVSKRQYLGSTVIPNFITHCTQIGACASLSTILYSPIGTAMTIVLAYNVIVICSKHVNYSLDITAKDYVQDQQLLTIMRYGILSCILLGMEVMFIEI
ncbi:conserved hypothetical protein [Leishmania major strain Friedlin]|uniref:Uncharacterized protein n=1 Tax=Leishmania major TaxID=5664 RepID=Q4Q474_LEIMA|nr:conserved hypothetical protein [Leishmania major strain Friedlin]CAG9580691.1 Succinate_dehydrogenase_subunit_4/SDH4 [Leishmania major strain Friedlin]CAJ06243.1 conserved hypothetical protein [Leishmania major strain Friedlin]|eukprot:XP_001685874.1 conserved hypothetical protein [Leishmania major strain Friedlin]